MSLLGRETRQRLENEMTPCQAQIVDSLRALKDANRWRDADNQYKLVNFSSELICGTTSPTLSRKPKVFVSRTYTPQGGGVQYFELFLVGPRGAIKRTNQSISI